MTAFCGTLLPPLESMPAIFRILGFVLITLLPSPLLLNQWLLTRGHNPEREAELGRVDRFTAVGTDERNIFSIRM